MSGCQVLSSSSLVLPSSLCFSLSTVSYRTTVHCYMMNWKCGPVPNVMAALSNTGGALCSTPQCLCSNAAKTRKPLKFAGVPQTNETISAASGPEVHHIVMTWGRYCCLTSFFPIVDTCLSCENIARQSCAMVRRWRFFASFLRPVFPASRVQHISDLHSKFEPTPCVEVW